MTICFILLLGNSWNHLLSSVSPNFCIDPTQKIGLSQQDEHLGILKGYASLNWKSFN
jgi:hypothetical protein